MPFNYTKTTKDIRMSRRRNRRKPNFFSYPSTEKKSKVKRCEVALDTEKLAAPMPQPSRRIVPHENLLVWGKCRGFGWWPGRIADRSELSGPLDPPDDPTRWIRWFGDNKFTETHVDSIAPFQEFQKFFRHSVYNRNKVYHYSVDEIIKEAAERVGKTLESEEKGLQWALSKFSPDGYLGFLPKIKNQPQRIEDPTKKETEHELEESDACESEFVQKRNEILTEVWQAKVNIDDICLGCGELNIIVEHPLFHGGLCELCQIDYQECMYSSDDCGFGSYCCICSEGGEILLCDNENCGKSFCTSCINGLVGAGRAKQNALQSPWNCYLCTEENYHGLLRRRENWRCRFHAFSCNSGCTAYIELLPSFMSESNKKSPIKVLSLFDGISTGMVALKALGISVETYYASEIDQEAICVSHVRHQEIRHIGDVSHINNAELKEWGPFDLLIGGSPCNDLAIVNPARKGLWSDKGTGNLFFEYVRILNACKLLAAKHQRPFFWLFENVVHMEHETRKIICRFLQTKPVLLNARDFSPANRPRFFWSNLPATQRPIVSSPGQMLKLQECLEPGRTALSEKMGTITTKSCTVANKVHFPSYIVTDESKTQNDTLWCTEIERVFGLPDHYTDVCNLSRLARLRLLGKSWSVPVMKHILQPLKDYYM